MAQYYQIVGQEQPLQTLTIEELRQFYPNITCVDANAGVQLQYVINNQDDNNTTTQFQSQQVLLTSDQQIVLNSGEAPQQIIVDQSQINYTQQTQQYVQDNEIVTDFQHTEISNTQQQIYYTPPQKQQIIPVPPQTAIINQQQLANQQQILNNSRIITQHLNQTPVRQMVPQQQINSAHLMQQHRRLSVGQQNQQQAIVQSTTAPRPLSQPNAGMLLQYTSPVVQEQQIQDAQRQNQPLAMDQDDNDMVMNKGRVMTLGRLKQELAMNQQQQQQQQPPQQENINIHKNTIPTNQSPSNCVRPPPKRAPRRSAGAGRGGGRAGKGRGAQNNRMPPTSQQQQPPQPNHNIHIASPSPKSFPLNNQKSVVQYQRNINQIKSPAAIQQPIMQQQQQIHHSTPSHPIQLPPPQQQQVIPQLQSVIPPQVISQQQAPVIPQQPPPPLIAQQSSVITQQSTVITQQSTVIQQQIQQNPLQQQQQHRMLPQQHRPIPNASNLITQNLQLQQQHSAPQIQVQQQQFQSKQQSQQQQLQQQQQQLTPYQQSPNGRNQPLIPLSPHQMQNGHTMQNNSTYSPPSSQGQQQYLDDSSSSLSDEYKDSARMLVCLENGEQRLITFTLPKDTCTVQDLLEQVGVPFNADTKIDCIQNPGNDIDYIVNVGAVNPIQFPVESQQVLTVDNLAESQECIVSQTGAVIPVTEPSQSAEIASKPKSPEKPPEPPKELPKFVPGRLALCSHCGYLSEDFNRCQRCKRKLADDVKNYPANIEQKQQLEKKEQELQKINIKLPPVKTPAKIATSTPKSTPKPRGKQKKAQEIEPVVLTLSSDDEDTTPKPTTLNRIIDNVITLSAIKKEPVIPKLYDANIEQKCAPEGIFGTENEDDMKINRVYLPCRTVRIGSYRFVPKDEVLITSQGLKINVPLIEDTSETFSLFVPMKFVVKILGSFSKALPVLFFYVTPSIGVHIRKHLKMEEGADLYFDSLSSNESFKRITLLPEIIDEDMKSKLKEIISNVRYKMLEELTGKEANEILIRSCPRDNDGQKHINSNIMCFTETRQLLIYPKGKGGIPIHAEDYLCLAQDQFLNDAIIDFYLKYLVTDVITTQKSEKVYIFSSFFYKRLTTKPPAKSAKSNPFESDANLSPEEKRHCRVKSWTKHVNIFDKDFVIIPINENSHWFLAIICYPGLEGCRSINDPTKVVKIPVKEKKKVNTITIGNTTITTIKKDDSLKAPTPSDIKPTLKCEDEEGSSDRDEAEGDESDLDDSETDSDSCNNIDKKNQQREPIKQPCILIFDSLAGASRTRVVATLRDYLTYEHRTKLKSTKTFTKDNIKGACPKVPQQMNFTDCGLYVLQYVESFFKDPISDYHIPIKMLQDWFEEIVVTRKREEIANLIKDLMLENNRDPNILPDISFPTLNGTLVSNMEQHYSDEEEEEELDHSESPEKGDNALTRLQMSNSDSGSESSVIGTKIKTTSATATTPLVSSNNAISTSSFIISDVTSIKPDISDIQKKSNRETMSYLKSKRIARHKNNENETKKQKTDE